MAYNPIKDAVECTYHQDNGAPVYGSSHPGTFLVVPLLHTIAQVHEDQVAPINIHVVHSPLGVDKVHVGDFVAGLRKQQTVEQHNKVTPNCQVIVPPPTIRSCINVTSKSHDSMFISLLK